MISLIRTILYSSAKYLGDLSAILKGRVIVRIFRRIAGKITARGLGGAGNFEIHIIIHSIIPNSTI